MGFAPFKIGSALRRILVVGLQRTSPDKGVVAGLVSNQKSIFLDYISFYLILASVSPHLPPHHGCAGPQTMVRLTKIFFGLSFGKFL